MFPEPAPSPAIAPSPATPRNQRYAYLVARLRNRQMTMEEATELFGLMDGMLRASEAARLAIARMPAAPSPEKGPAPPTGAPTPAPSSGSDDLFLLGILAMGAGAGMLAAMTKRIQDLVPPGSSNPPRSSPSSKSP